MTHPVKKEYPVLREGEDFYVLSEEVGRGSRAKRFVWVGIGNRRAIFKFDDEKKFRKGEDCSEKMASEIAKVLGYNVVDIELAEGINGQEGLLSFMFVEREKDEVHHDAEDIFRINKENEKECYTIEKMEKRIKDEYPTVDFGDFLRIMFFDALVGERDRHAGNWGIMLKNDEYSISPLYDTANCLLLHFANDEYMKNNTKTPEIFQSFINRNKTAIFKDDFSGNYSPVDSIVDYLLTRYPEFTKREIHNLFKLNDGIIEEIVDMIPSTRMSDGRKEWVIKFLKTQRDKIKEKGVEK